MNDRRLDDVHPIAPGHELPPEAGGKALGLRLIARAGLHVPQAWVVLPDAGASALDALARELESRGLRAVAVRSSAEGEDGARASFAGLHETALAVPTGRLREAVSAVAASVLSERAVAYRRGMGLPPARGPCAVIVQEMVDADAAGVAFGRDSDEVAVEAVEGLGEMGVSGEATPELLVLRRSGEGWTVVRREARRQPVALRLGPAGPERVPLGEAHQRGAVLLEAAAASIAAGVSALETAAGARLDVEWAVSGGRVAFLQARPQTRPVAPALPPGHTWTRANVRETTPELPCAFSRAFFVSALDRGMRINLRAQGVPADPAIPCAAAVHGRLVMNERVFLDVGDALGHGEPFRAWVLSLIGGTGGANEIPVVSPRIALRHPVIVARSMWWAARAEGNARRYLAWLEGRRAARGPRAGLDDGALLARALANPAIADSDRWIAAQTRLVSAIAGRHLLARPILGSLDATSLVPRLLEGAERSVSTRQIDELVALALAFRTWPGAAAFLVAPPREQERWRAALPSAVADAVDLWLAAYGHRGPFESDISSPRYREDLRLLAEVLRPLVLSAEPPERPEDRRLRCAKRCEETWTEIAGALSRLQRARLRRILACLSRLMALRERFRSEIMTDYGEVRNDLRELGGRWAAAGRLESGDDVFHLDAAELDRAVREPAFDARAAVRRELARRDAWRRITLPNRFTTEQLDAVAGGRAGRTVDGARVLRGTAVSPGQAEAPVCVLRTPHEGARMPTGAVMVAPATDPGWTPLFARAAAVVVEIGGLFSHAATVAREYGLPAVSNIEAATEVLRDGDVVTVDGSRGVVEVVSRARRP